jgi:hypothetical protein
MRSQPGTSLNLYALLHTKQGQFSYTWEAVVVIEVVMVFVYLGNGGNIFRGGKK